MTHLIKSVETKEICSCAIGQSLFLDNLTGLLYFSLSVVEISVLFCPNRSVVSNEPASTLFSVGTEMEPATAARTASSSSC